MITPSIEELTKDHFYNRYTLVAATAKCARIVTSEYVEQREYAERQIETKATDKSLMSMIRRDICDQKAVRIAVNRIYNKEYRIVEPPLNDNGQLLETDTPSEETAPAVTDAPQNNG